MSDVEGFRAADEVDRWVSLLNDMGRVFHDQGNDDRAAACDALIVAFNCLAAERDCLKTLEQAVNDLEEERQALIAERGRLREALKEIVAAGTITEPLLYGATTVAPGGQREFFSKEAGIAKAALGRPPAPKAGALPG